VTNIGLSRRQPRRTDSASWGKVPIEQKQLNRLRKRACATGDTSNPRSVRAEPRKGMWQRRLGSDAWEWAAGVLGYNNGPRTPDSPERSVDFYTKGIDFARRRK